MGNGTAKSSPVCYAFSIRLPHSGDGLIHESEQTQIVTVPKMNRPPCLVPREAAYRRGSAHNPEVIEGSIEKVHGALHFRKRQHGAATVILGVVDPVERLHHAYDDIRRCPARPEATAPLWISEAR